MAKLESVSASNPLPDSSLLCYCQAITQVIVNYRGSWQLNLKWVLSVLRGSIQSAMTLLLSRCVLNTEKLVYKWRNDVFLCSTETAIIVKAIMFGWIRPKKIQRWWYLEWRGTGPLSLQDKEMWQAGDEGYKGEELQRRRSSTCGFDCLSSLEWQLGHKDVWMKSGSGSVCSEQNLEI